MALVEMTCIIYLCGLIFADNPVPAQWNVTLPHTSINSVAFDTIMGAISILLDLAIVGVVQHTVWQLHMNNVHKIGLSLLFLLTAMSIIAGILRIIYIANMGTTDLTYTLAPGWLWASVEYVLYIICACLLIVYNLVRTTIRKPSQSIESSRRMPKPQRPLVTFGSSPPKGQRSISDDLGLATGRSDCYIISEPQAQSPWESHALKPLDPVFVRNEFGVVTSYQSTE